MLSANNISAGRPGMKIIIIIMATLLVGFVAMAQNVGIGTNSPQATLDVRGNHRLGGLANFISYDSATGRIGWINSNLYVPVSQSLIKHSAAGDGLFYNNTTPVSGQLEYRNAAGDPVFYTNFTNSNGYFKGNLGVGVIDPGAKLHVRYGVSGYTGGYFPGAIVEGSTNTYLNFLAPDISETGVLFGTSSDAASGGIVYNNLDNQFGLQFRTNGNIKQMVITDRGNVGIGTSTPQVSAQLDVSSTTKGLLPPRMTSVQRDAIPSPVAGLQIWCIDCKQLQVYDGSVWRTASDPTTYYPIVGICCQSWMTKNLDVATYRNGDPIPKVTDNAAWAALTTGAFCYYDNDSTTYAATYGKLYNWYAVNDPRGLAPMGWHIATDFEWTTLSNCLGGDAVAGGAMKEIGTTHWLTPNTGATNISGFTGLPGGYRSDIGQFCYLNYLGLWWTSTEYNNSVAWYYRLLCYSNILDRWRFAKQMGFSVRCIKN